VYRHNLHPHAARGPLPRGTHGLAQPEGVELAGVEHDGSRLLHQSPERQGDTRLHPGPEAAQGNRQIPLS